ncbi:hypothetical protein F4806DRAFT_503793 [Annulohypoxylon nitens]|nr:hypothetical protein F4806DRAFT_503793 [Annulohypoxylon nitens]
MATFTTTSLDYKLSFQTGSCDPVDLGDPDITGFGVLISFILSIVIAIVAILWAYFKDALPTKCYNEFDNLLINRKPRDQDNNRVHSFQGFILVLSDQQLVSGLALVISINIIRSGVQDLDTKISGYAYSTAVVLAFFSCIIHLATVTVLRDYLKRRGLLKNIRVAMMLCVIMLLVQAVVESWSMFQEETLRCALREMVIIGYSNDGTLEDRLGSPSVVCGLTILFGLLATGYVHILLDLYVRNPQGFLNHQLKSLLEKTIGWPTLPDAQPLDARRSLASGLSGSTWGISEWSRVIFLVIPGAFHRSFMFEVLWIIFYFFFGIFEVADFLATFDHNEGYTAISFEPKFGQLLPLILMILPFLAIVESYSDLRINRNHEEHQAEQEASIDDEEQDNEQDLEFVAASGSHRFGHFPGDSALRHRTVTPGARILVEDALLDGHILLRKGIMLMLPASVQHTNVSAWGEDADNFDYMRFVPKPGQKKLNKLAFRAFGGSHVLCPGRHFASTEIMAQARQWGLCQRILQLSKISESLMPFAWWKVAKPETSEIRLIRS